MLPISVVIPAPHGIKHCPSLAGLAGTAGRDDVEIIVVDGSIDTQTAPPFPVAQHVRKPGAGIFTLRREGFARASHEWIVLTEDHCVLPADFLEGHRAAIGKGSNAALLWGGVDSISITTRTAMTNYFFSYREHWPAAPRAAGPSIANLAIRKSALDANELAVDGGFEFLTLPRLLREGLCTEAGQARVDHAVTLSLAGCCRSYFNNARATAGLRRDLFRETAYQRACWTAGHLRNYMLRRPVSVLKSLKGVYPGRWLLAPGLAALSLSLGLGTVAGTLFGAGNSQHKI